MVSSQPAAPTSLATLVALLTVCVSKALQLSEGCNHLAVGKGAALHSISDGGVLKNKTVLVQDFEEVSRLYWLHAPPQPSEPAPLLIAFHGQTGEGKSFGESHNFGALGKDHNLMVVFPTGMDDSYSPAEDQGTGWNVGSAGDNSTCVPEGVGGEYGCYKSCRALKQCGRCNWSTCYDDVLFIKTLIKTVAQEFCIDLDRIYAQGESNGAMMIQHLVRELPDTFAGVTTWFGTPLVGYLLGKNSKVIGAQVPLSRTAYLAMHGRNDVTIPPKGGVDYIPGWIYEPLEQTTGLFAAIHHCNDVATKLVTRWDGGPLNFECVEYQRCSTGRRVVQCMYDGVHGDWPSGTDGDEITLWFLLQFTRSSPLALVDEAIRLV